MLLCFMGSDCSFGCLLVAETTERCVIEKKGKSYVFSGDCNVWKAQFIRSNSFPTGTSESAMLDVPPSEMSDSKSTPVSPIKKTTTASEHHSLKKTFSEGHNRTLFGEAMQWFFKPIKTQDQHLTRDMNVLSPQST